MDFLPLPYNKRSTVSFVDSGGVTTLLIRLFESAIQSFSNMKSRKSSERKADPIPLAFTGVGRQELQ